MGSRKSACVLSRSVVEHRTGREIVRIAQHVSALILIAARIELMSNGGSTLNRAILDAMDRHGAATCFRIWRAGRYRDVSYRHFRRQTLRLTRAFQQLDLKGERVAIWASSSPEWMITHMATVLAGAAVVPLRRSLPAKAIRQLLENCGARWVAVQTGQEALWLNELAAGLPELRGVLVLDDLEPDAEGAEASEDRVEIVELARWVAERLSPEELDAVQAQASAIEPDQPASIQYTATPEGRPLGAVFDQSQQALAFESMRAWLPPEDDDLGFTVLPWDYPPSLGASLYYFVSGVPNVLSRSRDLVFEEIQQVSPTLVVAIPNALERAYEEVLEANIRPLPASSQEIFQWALTTSKKLRAAGSDASDELRERHARADRTFFSGIRGAFGGRFRYLLCTGATLHRGLAESLRATGLVPINVYSLTETVGFPAVNPPDSPRPDACGPAMGSFKVRLADDGEVLISGPLVMREYWRQPEETERALVDGWLKTGDYGRFDKRRHLFLTGRRGDTLLLSTGRRVNPVPLEALLTESPLVDQAAVFGEGRPYVVAILVPDLANLSEHLRKEGEESIDLHIDDLKSVGDQRTLTWFWQSDRESGKGLTTSAHPRVKDCLDNLIAQVNSQVGEDARIVRYCLVAQRLSPESDRLVEVLTQNRSQLAQQFAEQLRSMYPQGVRSSDREITQVQVGPERLRELLEKESILDAWTADAGIGFLLDLARQHQIDTPSVIHICDTAASVAQVESEEKPLSTALIVGDPMRIHRLLPASLIQLHRHEHIRRMRSRLVDLSKLVDGLVLAYVIDRHGFVRGICRLEMELRQAPSALFGPRFRLHAEVSRRSDSVVFFVPKGGRQVRIFARGELVGRYSNGDWMPERASVLAATLTELAADGDYDPSLLSRVLRCAFRMSEDNHGAIFMIGDADRILAKSDSPDISHFAWISSAPVSSLSDAELINFAKQDGATIIDTETRRFRSCMVLLRPDAATRAEVGPGKGARHSSASKMSAEAQAVAITVSQDGPITIYNRGRRVLAL